MIDKFFEVFFVLGGVIAIEIWLEILFDVGFLLFGDLSEG